jgi:hypothetical protein
MPAVGVGFGLLYPTVCIIHMYYYYYFFLIHRSHSISFTRAQGIPKYKIGVWEGEGWESWGEIGRGGLGSRCP